MRPRRQFHRPTCLSLAEGAVLHPRGLSAVATTPGVTRPVVGIAEFPRFRGQVYVLRPSLSIGADQEAREVNKKVTKRNPDQGLGTAVTVLINSWASK